jgi:hypothetical protein
MRSYLFEAANVLLTRVYVVDVEGVSMCLAKRSGATRAKVALAASWRSSCTLRRDGTSFRWSTQEVSG